MFSYYPAPLNNYGIKKEKRRFTSKEKHYDYDDTNDNDDDNNKNNNNNNNNNSNDINIDNKKVVLTLMFIEVTIDSYRNIEIIG